MLTLDTLQPSDIKQVYRGRPGCCCGCNGTYRETDRAKKLMLRDLRTNADKVVKEDGHFFLDLGNRWLIAYLT